MTAMFYHFLAPEGGDPTWEKHFVEKISKYKVILSEVVFPFPQLNEQKQ